MTSVLEVNGLTTEIVLKSGTVRAVDDVSFHVEAGETLGLVGESGCGKSTIALSVVGLLAVGGHVVSGSVVLNGREITHFTDAQMCQVRGAEVGMIFQDPLSSLNPTMTIGRQIAEVVRLHRRANRKEAVERAVEVLDLVGLPNARERIENYPHQLSGGMRQRVMIAMALACDPKLLIADEPTTALDVTIQKQILDLIDELRTRLDMAVLLVTHDLGVIAGRADRVSVMYAGKLVETARTEDLFNEAQNPYSKALFEAVPQQASHGQGRLYSIPGAPPDLIHPPVGCCRFSARCQYAQERCRSEEPTLSRSQDGHEYACFYPLGLSLQDGVAWESGSDGERVNIGQARFGSGGGADVSTAARSDRAAARSDRASGSHSGSAGGAARIGRTDVILELDQLVKDFAVTHGPFGRSAGTVSAVAGVSLSVQKGSTFGLVGESGCGKTTLGRLIVGLERPSDGRIVLDGVDVTDIKGRAYKESRRRVQFMFQDSAASFDPRMRVGTSLREPLVIQRSCGRAEQRRRVARTLEQVGLPLSAIDRYPHEFSGGQRQRLGFARALMIEPSLIVADEPVSALDVSIQAQVLNMMRDLQATIGISYVFISHDLPVVRYLSETIGVMYLGKLVEYGPADEVYLRPAHHYTRGLLDSAPEPDPRLELAKKVGQGVQGELPSALDPPSGCRFRTRCSAAQELCAEVEPPMRAFGHGGHMAACHFPLEAPVASGAKLRSE